MNSYRLLLAVVAVEIILALALLVWLGYFYLAVTGLLKSFFAWATCLFGAIVFLAVIWRLCGAARRRGFRFSVRGLLVSIFAIAALLAISGRKLARLQQQRATDQALFHVHSRNGTVTMTSAVGYVSDRWQAASVTFSGVTLDERDLAQLARIRNLVSLTITNAPIPEDSFSLLKGLPSLSILVLENTDVSAADLEAIRKISPNWSVFLSHDELRQWSIERAREEFGVDILSPPTDRESSHD